MRAGFGFCKKLSNVCGIVPCWFSTRVFKLFFFYFYFVLFFWQNTRESQFSSPPCTLWNDSRCLIKEQKIQTRVIEKFCRFSTCRNEKVFTLWNVSFARIRVTIFHSNWLLLERERESHFRTVIALNNNVLIIIRYTRDSRSIICPFRLSHVQHVSYSRMRIRSRTFKK